MIGDTGMQKRNRIPFSLIAAGILTMLTAIAVVSFFDRLSIAGTTFALDWHNIWTGIAYGQITYSTGLVSPPWIALLLLPLGFLSIQASWGVISLVTLTVAVISVPRPQIHSSNKMRRLYVTSIFLITISWPLLRQLADGNLEMLVIGGTCLTLYSLSAQSTAWLAVGALLITTKPQECWLLIAALAFYLLMHWPTRNFLNAALICAVIIIPTFLWLGTAWLNADFGYPGPGRGTIIDMTWQATLNRVGSPGWLSLIGWLVILGATAVVCWISRRTFDRHKAGALIAASLLLAPYAAGNSILTILAVGIIPLFQSNPRRGITLILLCDLPILLSPPFQVQYGADFATLTTLILWGALCWDVWQRSHTNRPPIVAENLIALPNNFTNS